MASAARLAVIAPVRPSLATAQFSAKWNTYTNERFGFCFSYPSSLEPPRTPENGAGMSFSDGRMSVTVQAHCSFTPIGEVSCGDGVYSRVNRPESHCPQAAR